MIVKIENIHLYTGCFLINEPKFKNSRITDSIALYLKETYRKEETIEISPIQLDISIDDKDLLYSLSYCNILTQIDLIIGIYSFGKTNDIYELKELLVIIFKDIFKQGKIMEYYNEMQISDEVLANHTIRVAIISTILAIKAALPLKTIYNICKGAVLHDIGKLILFKKFPNLSNINKKYTSREYELIQYHPLLGYSEIVKVNPDEDINVGKIILLHHVWEQPDKSNMIDGKNYKSYPLMFRGYTITKKDKTLSVQIVQVADILEAMISKKPYQSQYHHKKDVLEYIYSQAGVEFSNEVVNLVKKFIAVYSIGEIVILNNGKLGKVVEQTYINNRPKILVCNNIIDLSIEDNLFIIGTTKSEGDDLDGF